MAIDDKIKDEKLQFDFKREGAKISALLSGKIDKQEYLIVEGISTSNRRQIIEQAKFPYFPLGKALQKQSEKQVDALNSLKASNKTDELKQIVGIFPKYLLNDLIINKLKKSLNCKIY